MAVQKADYIWRDFNTDGVPASGASKPKKREIRERGTWVENAISAGLSNGGLIYDTKANMNADLAHPANSSAWVIADATAANNGIYRKSGASGSGSWARIGDLPYSVVYAQNDGSGTANAIVATSSTPVSATDYSQLISVPFTAANTGPMTLAINGETPRPLVLNVGSPIPANYVSAGMSALAQFDSAGNYRLFSYGDASAIQAAAEAAQAAAEAAAAQVETALAALSPGGTGYDLIIADTPLAARIAANVRGRVNFFDFLQSSRTSAVREAIMNGTSTADLAVEWQAFRDALAAIETGGGKAAGLIPECKIYSSVAPNFAINQLRLETQGLPRIRAIGAVPGMKFDGTGLGTGGYGVNGLNIGPLMVETLTGLDGVYMKDVHRSTIANMKVQGATSNGFNLIGLVCTTFIEPTCSGAAESFIATPSRGMTVTGGAGTQSSWCNFISPIMEYVPTGISAGYALGCSFHAGTAEGCSTVGLSLLPTAQWNKFYGMDFEANTVADIYCEGLGNEFFGTDAAGGKTLIIAGANQNRIIGGTFSKLDFAVGTDGNLVSGTNYNANGSGYLSDAGTNIFRDNLNLGAGIRHNGPTPALTAIDITTQPLEDTARTWTNTFKQAVQVLWDSNATSAFYKTGSLRYPLGAGGQAIVVHPGDKIQIGYSSAPDVRYRFN